MDFRHACPKYGKAAALLGKKWTGMILRSLLEGPLRFTDIAAYVDGLSDNLLSKRLQELETEGIVIRQVLTQRPVVVEYSLTPKGKALREVVESIQRAGPTNGSPCRQPPANVRGRQAAALARTRSRCRGSHPRTRMRR